MSAGPNVTGLNLSALARPERGSRLGLAPNLLTGLRIVLAPFLVAAALERRFELAFFLFLLAAATDAMDGLLARWLRQRTRVGQYLDPIADKLLLSSLFLVLTRVGVLEMQVAVLVFSRDIGMLITAMLLYGTTRLRDFRPSLLGKANSFSQVVAIGFVLLSLIRPEPVWMAAKTAMLDSTIVLTVVSGFHYGWVASQRLGLLTDGPVESDSGLRGR